MLYGRLDPALEDRAGMEEQVRVQISQVGTATTSEVAVIDPGSEAEAEAEARCRVGTPRSRRGARRIGRLRGDDSTG